MAWHERFEPVIVRGPGQFPPFPDRRLPLDHPRPDAPRSRGARFLLPVPAPLREAVEAAVREVGATFSVAALVAFQVAVHEVTRADEALFAVVRGNRPTPEVQAVVANLVYAEMFHGERPAGGDGTTGAALLAHAARFLADAPLAEQPRAWMQLPPAIRVMFNYHNAALGPSAGPFAPAPDLSHFHYLWETIDVLWQVFSFGDGAMVSALYRDEVYATTTITALGDAFLTALGALARGVDGKV